MKKLLLIFLYFISACFSFGQEIIKKKENTVIIWDASLSMINRNTEKGFSFLSNYFEKYTDVDIKVIVFNNEIIDNKDFNIANGNWHDLKSYLENVVYDGSTNIDLIASLTKPEDEIILFADGISSSNETIEFIGLNDFVINSNTMPNEEKLLSDNFFSGFVYVDDQPTKNVEVSIFGKPEKIYTDDNGSFKINAKENDTLIFKYEKFDEIEYSREKSDRILITFFSNTESLDEVIVRASVKKDNENEKVISAYGLVDKRKVGYAIQSITDKDISSSVSNVSQAIQGKFSGANYGQNQDLSQIVIRGGSNSILSNNYGLIVIDGVPMPRSTSKSVGLGDDPSSEPTVGIGKQIEGTGYLDPNNIANVTILKGLAATNRYGSEGANGVILITTKTGYYRKDVRKKELTILNNNIYNDEDANAKSKSELNYIKELKRIKNVQKAYDHYLNQRMRYLNNAQYFINVYDFFKESNTQIASKILSNILELFPSDVSTLRLLAYKYNIEKKYKPAIDVFERILELSSIDGQSYLDLAMAYADNLNYEESLKIYKDMTDDKLIGKVDFSGLSKTIDNDFRDFLRQNKSRINISEIKPKYLHNTQYDARIVLKWNNPNAEFVVQFVNPVKRFITWDHTFNSNSQRIKDEISKGFHTKEFHIDGDIKELKGEWIMNIKDLGSNNKAPNYFEITLFSNFGRTNQSKKVELFSTEKHNENENVLKFRID